jgi:phospholipid-transporting ATPase
LRTLCLAYRDISFEEYANWSSIYDTAARTINNRAEELDKAAELIEKDLTLLGSTAIEDRLQDGVPDTIHTLMEAGIKVWVLTGDRQETAINIGYSCKLITPEMNLIICNESNKNDTKIFLETALSNMKNTLGIGNALASEKKIKHFFFPKSRKAFGKDFEVDTAVLFKNLIFSLWL